MGNFGIGVTSGLQAPEAIQVTEGSSGSSKGSTYGTLAQGALTAIGAMVGGVGAPVGAAAGAAAKAGLSTLDTAGTSGSVKKTQSDNVVPVVSNVGSSNPYSATISGPDVIGGISPTTKSASLNLGSLVSPLNDLAKSTGAYDSIKNALSGNVSGVSGFGSGIDWSNLASSDYGTFAKDALSSLSSTSPYASELSNLSSADLSSLLSSSGLDVADWADLFSSLY